MFSTFRGLPPTVWTLFAGTIINRLGYLVTPFLVFFLAARGITGTQTSYVLGALGAGNLLGPAIGGLLADRIGRRSTMLIGLLGASTAQGALFMAPGVLTMACAALLLSATGAMISPAVYALMADSVDAERRRRAYALFGWGINIGTAAAGVLGGFLAAHGYWLLFAVDAGTMLAYSVVVATRVTETRAAKDRTGARDGVGYGVVLRDRLMLALLPLFGVQLFVYSLTEVALPLAIHDSALSPAVYGAMAAVNAVLVVVLQPFATARLARFPQIPVHAAGGVLIAGVWRSPVSRTASWATRCRWSSGRSARRACPGSPPRSSRTSPRRTHAAATRERSSGPGESPGSPPSPWASPSIQVSARPSSGGRRCSVVSSAPSRPSPSPTGSHAGWSTNWRPESR